jgi:hypothetical protein
MALVDRNDATEGLRGKFGRMFVFRKINGKTYASRAPRRPDKTKETMLQRGTRLSFREATAFAKRVLKDPAKKAFYLKMARELKLPNAYTAAITEFMRARNSKPAMVKTFMTVDVLRTASVASSNSPFAQPAAFAWAFPFRLISQSETNSGKSGSDG